MPMHSRSDGEVVVLSNFGRLMDDPRHFDAIEAQLASARVVLYMKGTPDFPQCGFSSTHHGNNLSQDDQWRKLERIVEVAREVWG